jgi:3-phosphoshikimate 1-carboxyvinyltransferase
MLAAISSGTSEVRGFLASEDCLNTLKAMQSLGAEVEHAGEIIRIKGTGGTLHKPSKVLDMGNSGTALRLLTGIMAGQSFDATLVGDASLSTRPMRRITRPLEQMGADIVTKAGGTPPLAITGKKALRGIHYDLPVASAQVKSAILLAGLYADGETSVTEPAVTRDHTERMLRGFGYKVVTEGSTMSLQGGGELTACTIDVPADISSAAFFMVGASIAEGSDLTLEHVGVNPTRTGVIDILNLMGADITLSNQHEVGGEPVADIRIRSAPLKGINIPEHLVPLAIDEFPVLFIAACFAKGQTVLTGAEELRVKESDRIQVMADGLLACGADVTPTPDGIIINNSRLTAGEVNSQGDHRIAMAFAMAGLCAEGALIIHDCENVDTSFPHFIDIATQAGVKVSSL